MPLSSTFLAVVALALGTEAPPFQFREVASEWGIGFRHHHGGSGRFYMVENVGAGVVVFDYDGDGDLDLFFVDSGALPGYEGEPGRSILYRNESRGAEGDVTRFRDVTEEAGIVMNAYGMGATAGDIDGDLDLDLYVTAFGRNQLFRNNGDGSFTDVTEAAAVGDASWSSSAAFSDVDRDGDLDLYVVNYLDFSFDNNPLCGLEQRGLRSYCNPDVYSGLPDRFYRNRGDGTFIDATGEAGFAAANGKGLGLLFGDIDANGWPDLYVANDVTPNFLFRNRGDGTFEEIGLFAGVAYSDRGSAEAGMGIDLGDLDGDGQLELMVTNFDVETNALYAHVGAWSFIDRRYASQLAGPSLYQVGFGLVFADLDRDADLDVAVANGHTIHNIEEWGRGSGYRYRQPNQLFVNDGAGRFVEAVGHGLTGLGSSRALAFGDLDGDGDLDLVFTNSNEAPEVYENITVAAGGWLEVLIENRQSNRNANRHGIGSRIEAIAGERRQQREVRTASSYLSQNALAVFFGLGAAEAIESLILSEGERKTVIRGLPANRRIVVRR